MPTLRQTDIIKEALDSMSMLSEWEALFIDDIADLEPLEALTYQQNKVLEEIAIKIDF